MKDGSKSGKQTADRAVSRRLTKWLRGEYKDGRPKVRQLLKNIKAALPGLRKLLRESSDEDRIYRFYHHSFKVFYLQDVTLRIVAGLPELPKIYGFGRNLKRMNSLREPLAKNGGVLSNQISPRKPSWVCT